MEGKNKGGLGMRLVLVSYSTGFPVTLYTSIVLQQITSIQTRENLTQTKLTYMHKNMPTKLMGGVSCLN